MGAVPPAARWLGLAGLLPFLAAAAADAAGLFGPAAGIVLAAYGATILSFLGGTLWGFACAAGRAQDWPLLGVSVLPSLVAAAALILGLTGDRAPFSGFELLAAGFVVQLLADLAWRRAALVPDWWMALRLPLTMIAVICLLIGAYL